MKLKRKSIKKHTVDDLYRYARMKRLVGEEDTFITAVLSLISPNLNVLIESPSGAGKTHIADIVIDLHRPYYQMSTASPKADIYTSSMRDAKLIYLPELQKMAQTGTFIVEMLKDFGEGKAYRYRVTYKDGGRFKSQTIDIPHKNFLTTVALGNKLASTVLDMEFGRRVLKLYTDTSKKMNRQVMDEYAALAKEGEDMNDVVETPHELVEHIRRAKQHHLSKKIVVPYSAAVIDALDDSFVISRTISKQAIELLRCIVAFNNIDSGEDTIVADMEDLNIFSKYMFDTLQNQAMHIPNFGKRIIQIFKEDIESAHTRKSPQKRFFEDEQMIGDSYSINRIQYELRKQGYVVDLSVLKNTIRTLMDAGYVEIDDTSKGKANFYKYTGYAPELSEIDMKYAQELLDDYNNDYSREYSEKGRGGIRWQ